MSSDTQCTFRNIQELPQDQVCDFVDQNCNVEQLVKFSYFYFCQVKQNIIVLDLLTILIPLYAFRMLSQISEYYLSPALAKVSKCFKLSQSVAGVTLLALGNGGPDVATAIVAGSSGGDSITIAVGSIFGAGLFVTTYTLQNVIQNAGSIHIKSKTFVRDMVFYLIGCCVVFIYTIVGSINLGMAIGFMSIYGLFLFTVIYQDRQRAKQEIAQSKIRKMDTIQTQRVEEALPEIPLEQKQEVQINCIQANQMPAVLNTLHDQNEERDIEGKSFVQDEQNNQNKEGYDSIKRQETAPYNKNQTEEENSEEKVKDIMTEKYENFWDKFKEMGILERLLILTEIPIDVARYLIIPPAEENQWNKWRAMITTITGPLAFMWGSQQNLNATINDEGFLVIYIVLIISFIASILIFFFTKNNQPPQIMWLFSIFSFVVAVVLLGQAAQVMIDFINFFQIVTNMNKTFLGMTVLAWGNSATDFFLNSSLASIGYGVMAATGCFAGQAFDLYLGFGIALIFYSNQSNSSLSIFTGSSTLDWINNSIAISVILFVIISSAISIIVGLKLKFSYDQGKYTTFLKYYYLCALTFCIILCAADQFYE
ncbi:sodium calcium exchanger protein (macronuclear) [Tetrahymena thermophila SB210]|uniref:Sodium calcium exchanger protein n=1 Tax=Tetrahymena thermophila (strain SB210) TaxID=312017 RepID=I7M2B7_TETTS|nr:sodium calcium exchanger protein [Tetrahymena thermophila SB210]EAR99699.2 sodium calcium exchanger protein [Tetrahymena thermophila SB210]|eukprot:XP_001019945.2 sodium calcium exchanger protein [Tetrahymena thermophila SB210]